MQTSLAEAVLKTYVLFRIYQNFRSSSKQCKFESTDYNFAASIYSLYYLHCIVRDTFIYTSWHLFTWLLKCTFLTMNAYTCTLGLYLHNGYTCIMSIANQSFNRIILLLAIYNLTKNIWFYLFWKRTVNIKYGELCHADSFGLIKLYF